MLTLEEFHSLYDQGPDAVYAFVIALQTTTGAQQEQIAQLTARVKQLEDRLGKDSHNSSKPPSSDGLSKKPNPKSLRGKSGRRSGGQPGHPGRTLEFAERPDQTVVHSPEQCQHHPEGTRRFSGGSSHHWNRTPPGFRSAAVET